MTGRVLLAGCGDLGMRVAQRLLARGDEVWALRRSPARDGEHGVRWVRGDLTQAESLRALPGGITRVVYSPTPGVREEAAYRAIFVDGLKHLLGALSGAPLERVLFVSSSAVYGEHGDGWVDEATPPAPPGFNGRVLLEAERWLAAQAVPSVSLRLAGIYGPGRMQLLERLRAGEARVPRDPPHWSNRIHVDDAAAAVMHLLELSAAERVYVGADDTPLPMHVLYEHLAGLIGAPRPEDGAAPPGIGSKRLSNARLRASGFAFRWTDAREGYRALL
ncbi:SDR family oxidoreductase [Dyella sp. LX-66]|uniref:SDR family oxidoreductase n=1 Tax=unclassified Dyella TaxID=2634549 RepID=UPI001BDF933C|nr:MULTISPECIES: SDR family oxidoreductase [unclassified Dyella]MBT2115450.1 SDR family oxidoreductase [Dyella sp. LX-1]MBT2139265.1 SDR family oxidoreductase [Dyella sp. LX-66]